jgi:cytidine deaminase
MTALNISEVQKKLLLEMAKSVRERSYSPYSKFKVGAAIMFDNGEIVCGCNVENASYGASLCAERNAMSTAVSQGLKKPIAIAVAGNDGVVCPPCGICRQFLMEFNPDIAVILDNEDIASVHLLREMLPMSFSLKKSI